MSTLGQRNGRKRTPAMWEFPRSKVYIGKMIKKTIGGHHAWYESNVGPVRRPL